VRSSMLRFLCVFVALAFLPLPGIAATLTGRVIGVYDGDSITVLDAGRRQYKIRLIGIDASEFRQAFGTRSKQNLSDLVFGKDVVVEWKKHVPKNRILGKVLVDDSGVDCGFRDCRKTLDAGLAQVRDGFAWHYKQYEREQSPEDRARYASAERNAREKRSGLWADPQPVPPWEWRHTKKSGTRHPSSPR